MPDGSPPQVRGKLINGSLPGNRFRITPAGAGKTQPHADRHAANQDHPRRCGENHAAILRLQPALGSPPQVRGKHDGGINDDKSKGITPAGAGKTSFGKLNKRTNQDHPRRCGENFVQLSSAKDAIGSPPQVRGKPANNAKLLHCVGITPAGAGKTGHINRIRLRNWDHPRRCGENSQVFYPVWGLCGSPPQVRGKLASFATGDSVIGITPAGAGKTYPK